MTEQLAAVIETPAPATEDDAMGAIWDKFASDGIETESEAPDGDVQEEKTEEVAVEPAKAEEPAPEPEKPAIEAPSDLPQSLRDKWADMPESAREAVLADRRDLSRKMADLGRVSQVAKPVYDVIVQAANEIPTLKDMTPQQIAGDVFKMAKIQGAMNADPVNTLLQIAKQYGAVEGIQQALTGQPVQSETPALLAEIKRLQNQIAQIADPKAIETRIEQNLTARETERIVQEYAAQKPHWADVESILPQFVAIVQQRGDKTSPTDILDAAYDMAIHAMPDLRAKVQAVAPVQPMRDPQQVEAQLKAKSVNVVSSPSKPKPLTEDQMYGDIYDRLTRK